MSDKNFGSQASSSSSTTDNETKVYYFIDDSGTPYSSTIPISPEVATLADFKQIFTKKGYKYYCKELDPEIGCDVKIELTDDSARLKRSGKRVIELYLLSIPGYGTLPRAGTLPRKDKMPPSVVNERMRRRRSNDFDNYGIAGPSSSHPASSMGTVFSRRAGEQLAEVYTSTTEDPYRFDESSRVSGLSSFYEPHGHQVRKRTRRKERFRKPYVPSTKGSTTDSSMSQELGRIVEVRLSLTNLRLGIAVISIDGCIFVSDVSQDGAAFQNGQIETGDQIIQVNNRSFEHIDDQAAVQILREVAHARRPLTLFVVKNRRGDSDYDPLASLATDTTLPLDISVWCKTAAQLNQMNPGERPDDYTFDQSDTFNDGTLPGETDDEEERALYDQRRNGIPLHLLEAQERRRENEQNEHQLAHLSTQTDRAMVIQVMARKDSKLQVKNRKWLKIPVDNSFIGSELVDWLLDNLNDLKDRKAARQYAAGLLDAGHIKHVVSKISFTEKCYYVFGGARVGSDSTSSGTMRADATTEVTYVGSPAPNGMRPGLHPRQPLQTIPHIADQTWPISPITVMDKTQSRIPRRKDCESPVTNDYASMVGVGEESTTSYGRGIGHGGYMMRGHIPPNTPLSGNGSTLLSSFAQPHPSPCETEFEDDDKRRMMRK